MTRLHGNDLGLGNAVDVGFDADQSFGFRANCQQTCQRGREEYVEIVKLRQFTTIGGIAERFTMPLFLNPTNIVPLVDVIQIMVAAFPQEVMDRPGKVS